MTNVLNILCQSQIFDANEALWSGESASTVVLSIAIMLLVFLGIAFLIYWLATTSFGTAALDDSRARRNAMAFYIPLIPFGIWIALSGMAAAILNSSQKVLSDYQEQLLTVGLTTVIAIALLAATVVIAKAFFVRGFKGLGFDIRTFGKDLIGGATKLLAVWPLVLGVLLAIAEIGKLIYGPDFEIAKHEELETLLKYHQWPVRVAVIFLAVVLAPLTEEMLFRGLFQTMFRNVLRRPWIAIVFASGLFAMSHQNWEHWPALFVLAVGLGYAYEKSGSLLQPIFMHAIFNGAMVTATLLQG